MFTNFHRLSFVTALYWISGVAAQYHAFQWKFGNNFVDEEFQECQTLPVIVETLDGNINPVGVPPYYLIAFELGGVPTTTNIGSKPGNLSWTNTHKRGSVLMLGIVDSNATTPNMANTGGQSPILFNVTENSDTSCLNTPSDTSSLASVHPNVTDTLTTCEPWGLTITGGQKPYTIVLSATGSPIVTNVSMGANDDVFTFPDRADPNVQLMASVMDASGRWGVSTSTIHTTGSKDTNCTGLVSSSKTSQEIQQEAQAREQAATQAQQQQRLRLGLGLGIGIGVPLLLALVFAFWFFVIRPRRDPHIRGIWDHQDAFARPWQADTEMREVDAASTQHPPTPSSVAKFGSASHSPTATPFMQVTPIPPNYFDRELPQTPSTSAGGTVNSPSTPSGTASSPGASAAADAALTRKAREALQGRRTAERSRGRIPVRMDQLVRADADPDTQPDIIIQHRDGGGSGVVQELPPPYVDRSLVSSSSSVPSL